MRDRPHDEVMAEIFRKEPDHAVELLNAIFEDGEEAELMIVLRQMSIAFDGVYDAEKQMTVDLKKLYRDISAEGELSFSSLTAILRAMGLRLSVTPLTPSPA